MQSTSYIGRNSGLEETQAGIKIAGRNISNLRYTDDTTFMIESEEELENFLMKVKEESENAGYETPDIQAGFRKGRGTRDQIANVLWVIEKSREFQKNIYFCFTD